MDINKPDIIIELQKYYDLELSLDSGIVSIDVRRPNLTYLLNSDQEVKSICVNKCRIQNLEPFRLLKNLEYLDIGQKQC